MQLPIDWNIMFYSTLNAPNRSYLDSSVTTRGSTVFFVRFSEHVGHLSCF